MKPCGFCGTPTSPDTMLAGLITCEACLIDEVQTYLALQADGTIAKALAISPKESK